MKDFGERKEELKVRNQFVRRPIERLDRNTLVPRKTRKGRTKKYTPTRMVNGINKYFAFCEEHDEVPSIKGMMLYLKMYKDMFYKYIQYPEFTDIMEQARMTIANWCELDVYRTKGQAAGKIAYMKNIHDWSDKLDTRNETTQTVKTVGEARAKIESLAPLLLEALQSDVVVKQIAREAEIVEEDGNA